MANHPRYRNYPAPRPAIRRASWRAVSLMGLFSILLLTSCSSENPQSAPQPHSSATTEISAAAPETDQDPPALTLDEIKAKYPALADSSYQLTEVTLRWEFADATAGPRALKFGAEIADYRGLRNKGLSGRPELDQTVGMLFLFDQPDAVSFWMQDTLIPLDIAWIRAGKVLGVTTMPVCTAKPCPSYAPPSEIDAALEVNAGLLEHVPVGAQISWSKPVG